MDDHNNQEDGDNSKLKFAKSLKTRIQSAKSN